MPVPNPFDYINQGDQLISSGKEKLTDSLMSPQMDQGQVLSVLLGSALPALFGGLLGGSTGLQAGAAGGLTGAEFGLKQAAADAERKQKLQALLGEQDIAAGRELKKSALAAASKKDPLPTRTSELKRLLDEGKMSEAEYEKEIKGSGKTNVTVNSYAPGGPLPKDVISDIQGPIASAASAQSVINEMYKEIPELAQGETIRDANGNIAPLKIADVVGRRLKAKTLGSEDPLGKVNDAFTRFVARYNKELSGAASTDKEFERNLQSLQSSGIVPATIPTLINVLETFQREQGKLAKTRALTYGALASPTGDKSAAIDTLLNQVAPGSKGQSSMGMEQPKTIQEMALEELKRRGIQAP